MFRFRPFMILLVLALMTGTGLLAQAQGEALVRFAHAIPGAASVDIYADGQLTATNLDFGEATVYIHMPAEQHQITVTPVGATTALWEQTFTPGADKAYTLVASSFDEPVEFVPFEDQLDPLSLGKARFTTIHAIADGPSVDVLLDDGRPLVLAQSYNQPFGTLDVPVFDYNLVVVPAGQDDVSNSILTLDHAALNTGTSYMLLLYGTAANPQYTLLSAPTRPASAGDGFVRFVDALPGADGADVYLNGTLSAALTSPASDGYATDYIALPAGDYDVELHASGAADALLTSSISVSGGQYSTAIAQDTESDSVLNILPDGVGAAASDQALVRVVNAGSEALSASLADGTIIANNLDAGQTSDISGTDPATLSVILSSAGAGMSTLPEQDFYGGVFYDILALGDTAEVTSAALNAGIGSAPGAGAAVMIAAQPTQAPAVEATVAPVQPVAAPQATPAPIVAPTNALPAGRVFNLNVDANLQLRQYPSPEALSLGTVPFGTILTVNGREGALEEIFISATQMPPDYEYTDSVSLLPDDKTDLAPEETWLNVSYATPDGGTIDAWVRSDFVDVRDARGEKVRLRDLETVPGNRPGEARNTDITPPPGRKDVVTVRVTNIDQGANLNLRRTPEIDGEVLAQLPLNTVAELVGLSEEGDWAFVSYAAPDGTTTTGWASTSFLVYELNGASTDLDTLQEKGLLAATDLSTRGDKTIGGPSIVVPTVDPTIDAVVAEVALDPGANLNLRRSPDVNAEVLAQVPSGTRVIVSERTEDAQWLNVTYEGVTGWIAAQTDSAVFVRLSFNGNPYSIEDVPVTVEAG